MNNLTTYFYKESPIQFEVFKGSLMANATLMGKLYNVKPEDLFKTKSWKAYQEALCSAKNYRFEDLRHAIQGGNSQGTWIHQDLIVEFSRRLNPAFSIWCNDRIAELLREGKTEIKPKELSRKDLLIMALEAEEQKELALLQVENLSTALDNLLDWVSIIKVSQLNRVSENVFNWRILKKKSEEMGYSIKRAESGRFTYQNLYNVNVFKACYPAYSYDFKVVEKNLLKN